MSLRRLRPTRSALLLTLVVVLLGTIPVLVPLLVTQAAGSPGPTPVAAATAPSAPAPRTADPTPMPTTPSPTAAQPRVQVAAADLVVVSVSWSPERPAPGEAVT